MTQKSKPTLPEVIPLVKQWYAEPERAAGDLFHVILEDKNYQQCHATTALENARESGNPQAIELAEKLVAMSATQRRKLSATWSR